MVDTFSKHRNESENPINKVENLTRNNVRNNLINKVANLTTNEVENGLINKVSNLTINYIKTIQMDQTTSDIITDTRDRKSVVCQ